MKDVRTDGQPKRVFIRTYGCQMNVYDSDRMADALAPHGYEMFNRVVERERVGLNAAFQFCNMKVRPTAIFSMNDEMAIGAMQTLKNQGIRIPEDMSVTGFDDIAYAKYSDPSLTTISQPAEEMGKMAMDMLLKVIEGEPLSQRECVLPTEFIIRKSTGPLLAKK